MCLNLNGQNFLIHCPSGCLYIRCCSKNNSACASQLNIKSLLKKKKGVKDQSLSNISLHKQLELSKSSCTERWHVPTGHCSSSQWQQVLHIPSVFCFHWQWMCSDLDTVLIRVIINAKIKHWQKLLQSEKNKPDLDIRTCNLDSHQPCFSVNKDKVFQCHSENLGWFLSCSQLNYLITKFTKLKEACHVLGDDIKFVLHSQLSCF